MVSKLVSFAICYCRPENDNIIRTQKAREIYSSDQFQFWNTYLEVSSTENATGRENIKSGSTEDEKYNMFSE